MIIYDSAKDEQIIRLNGLERTRITRKPAHFPPNKTDAEIETLLKDFIDARVSSDGHHSYLHIHSRSPLHWSVWLGPVSIEPPATWWDLGN